MFWHAIDNVNEDEIKKQEEKLLEHRKNVPSSSGPAAGDATKGQEELIHTI